MTALDLTNLPESVNIAGIETDPRDADGVLEGLFASTTPRANRRYFFDPLPVNEAQAHQRNLDNQALQYLNWLHDRRTTLIKVMSNPDMIESIGSLLDRQVSIAPDLAPKRKDDLWSTARGLAQIHDAGKLREIGKGVRTVAKRHEVEVLGIDQGIIQAKRRITESRDRAKARGWEPFWSVGGAMIGGAIGLVTGGVVGMTAGSEGGAKAVLVVTTAAGVASGAKIGHEMDEPALVIAELQADLTELHRLESNMARLRQTQVSVDTLDEIFYVLADTVDELDELDPSDAQIADETAHAEMLIRKTLDQDRRTKGRTGPDSPAPPPLSNETAIEPGGENSLDAPPVADIRVKKFGAAAANQDQRGLNEAMYEMADVRNESNERDAEHAEEREESMWDKAVALAEMAGDVTGLVGDFISSAGSYLDW